MLHPAPIICLAYLIFFHHPIIIAGMEYTLLATLGPATHEPDLWQALLSAGATGFRLNTSHLSLDQLQEWLDRLQVFFDRRGQSVPLALDLQGSKWRLGQFSPFHLNAGEPVQLVLGAETRQANTLPVPHPDFFAASAHSGEEITLDDARLHLRRISAGPDWLQAQVVFGGNVLPRKGITYAASEYRQEALNEKDWAILEMSRELPFARFAISYVKDAEEMRRYRTQMGSRLYLIAKLERQPAVEQVTQVAESADELWLCRGDLGAELGLRGMAGAAARFGELAKSLPRPALLAGQVLEHMTHHAHPTRSEVSYIYESLLKGYRGFVLSDETAIGQHPVEACRAAALFKNNA